MLTEVYLCIILHHVHPCLPYVCLCFLSVSIFICFILHISILHCETQLFTCIACLMFVSVIMFTKLQKSGLNCMSYILKLYTYVSLYNSSMHGYYMLYIYNNCMSSVEVPPRVLHLHKICYGM